MKDSFLALLQLRSFKKGNAKMNPLPISFDILVKSSLGKRKPDSLFNLTESKLSITLCSSAIDGLHANCWLRDTEGRVLGMVIDGDDLQKLSQQIQAAQKVQKAFGSDPNL